MDPVTFYRLGQLRHVEILEQAARDHLSPVWSKAAATALIGRWLLAVGARLVASSGCANVASRNYTISVCPARSA